jgi:uncharacterized protein YuzE
MRFKYDRSADVMYVSVLDRTPQECFFSENDNGDVLKIDKTTNQVVGVTIISFLSRIQRGFSVDVPEIGELPLKKQATRLLKESKRA